MHITSDRPQTRALVAAFQKKFNRVPTVSADYGYTGAMVLDAALQAVKGNIEGTDGFLAALAKVQVEAPRGPIKFDKYHNVVQNIYIIEVKKVDGKLVNAPIQTLADVSQFWKWTPEEYLKMPTYSDLKGKWVQ